MGIRILQSLAPLRIGNVARQRWAVALFCALVAASLLIFATPAPGPLVLNWGVAGGSHRELALRVFSGLSWGTYEPQIIELHTSTDPESPVSQWGIAHISTDLSGSQNLTDRRIVFRVTQPDWIFASVDATSTAPLSDGVLITFRARHDSEVLTLKEYVLTVEQEPAQRRWNDVVIDIPANTSQLEIIVSPRATVELDRVWITVGERSALFVQLARIGVWLVYLGVSYLIVMVLLTSLGWARSVPLVAERLTRATPHFEAITQRIVRHGFILIACCCLFLGYLLVWQRGFYLDDYSNYSRAIDPVSGEWRWPGYVATQASRTLARLLGFAVNTLFAGLIPQYEFAVRFIFAAGLGVTALMVGGLTYRMIGSRIAAGVSGSLLIIPVFSPEAVLWAGTAAFLAVGLSLAMVHALWSAIERPESAAAWALGGVIAFFGALLLGEVYVLVLSLMPLLALMTILKRANTSWRPILVRLGIIIAVPAAIGAIFYRLFYAGSALIASRGGLDTDPASIVQRIPEYFSVAWWMIGDEHWGRTLITEAFSLGVAHLSSSGLGVGIFIATYVLIAILATRWHSGEPIQHRFYTISLLAVLYGIIWCVLTLLIPNILVKGQILANRQLFMPYVGLCIAVGAIVAIIAQLLRSRIWERLLIVGFGTCMLAGTICMLGYAQAFALRSQLDNAQIEKLTAIVPADALPRRTIFIPYNTDEQLTGVGSTLNRLMVGVFEAHWSTRAAINQAYNRNDLTAVTANRWVSMRFRYIPGKPKHPGYLYIQNSYILPERAVFFTYQNDTIVIVRTLTLTNGESNQVRITFPIAEAIEAAGEPVTDVSVQISE